MCIAGGIILDPSNHTAFLLASGGGTQDHNHDPVKRSVPTDPGPNQEPDYQFQPQRHISAWFETSALSMGLH